jgi:hypothetical protein
MDSSYYSCEITGTFPWVQTRWAYTFVTETSTALPASPAFKELALLNYSAGKPLTAATCSVTAWTAQHSGFFGLGLS